MKIKNIRFLHDWGFIDFENGNIDVFDPENSNIDVFVDVENGFTYVLTVATPKNMESLMEKEGLNYYGPGYPFLLVKTITEDIIKEAIYAHAEDDGYWIKLYHFSTSIKETMFQELEAEQRKENEDDTELTEEEVQEVNREIEAMLERVNALQELEAEKRRQRKENEEAENEEEDEPTNS